MAETAGRNPARIAREEAGWLMDKRGKSWYDSLSKKPMGHTEWSVLQ